MKIDIEENVKISAHPLRVIRLRAID